MHTRREANAWADALTEKDRTSFLEERRWRPDPAGAQALLVPRAVADAIHADREP